MAGSSISKRVPSEQRVFSLVLALIASPQGLTKSDLLSSVYGYAARRGRSGTDASLERQFERDKVQVRQLGIPIEAIDSPLEPGNNQLTRYRISKDRLRLPSDVRFTADELTLLNLASLAWSDGSLGAQSRWASMKLASLAVNLDVRHLGIAPRLSIPEPAAPALQQAIDEGRVVRFDYQLPGRVAAMERRVAPLRLHRAEARWHLIAYDLERDDDRVFLLSRISSEVRIEAKEYDSALNARVDGALSRLLQLGREQRAELRVRRGSVAEARLAPRDEHRQTQSETSGSQDQGTALINIGTLDLHALAAELAGYGDEVHVVSPASLRDEVAALLETVLRQHTDGAGDHHG